VSDRARDTAPSFFDRLPWFRRPVADRADRTARADHGDGGTPGGAGDLSFPALVERLDAIERALADLARRLPPTDPDERMRSVEGGAVAPALAALEKSVGRAGREQFKALALAQAQQEQLAAALDALRADDARRAAELAAWPARSRDARDAARLEMAQSLFPTLDGLDEAIRSGHHLLDRPAAPPSSPPSFLERLVPHQREETARGEMALRAAMEAWLTGLTFVCARLLDMLAAESVRPIDAVGWPFDPHYHIAAEVAPSGEGLAPGTVAAELRRGYTTGDRVLRYAEVAVVADRSQ